MLITAWKLVNLLLQNSNDSFSWKERGWLIYSFSQDIWNIGNT